MKCGTGRVYFFAAFFCGQEDGKEDVRGATKGDIGSDEEGVGAEEEGGGIVAGLWRECRK